MNNKGIYGLLLGWIATGLLFNLDLSQQWGCIPFPEAYLLKYRVGFALVSIILLTIGFLAEEKTTRTVILCTEVFLWLLLLYLVKGGYAVGFAGGAKIEIQLYDFFGLLLRVVFLTPFLNSNRLPMNNWTAKLFPLLIAGLGIYVKTNYFNLPLIFLN